MERSIFYSMTERELFESDISDRSLEDIKSKGFDTIYLEYRNTKCSFENPRFQKGVSYICKKADEMGLKVFAHAHFRQLTNVIAEECPEAFSDRIQPCTSHMKNGRFVLTTYGENLHNSVEKCYFIERRKNNIVKKCIDITDRIRPGKIHTEGGGCQMTKGTAFATTGREYFTDGLKNGEIFAVVKYKYVYSSPDLSNPKTRQYNDRMLKPFENLPVIGFSEDEPHVGFDFFDHNSRVISESLYNLFIRKFGYDLKQKLIHLWFDIEGEDSCIVRYHYSELIEGVLEEDERDFMEKSDKIMQRKGISDYVLGIHRTMHEETSDDLYIGSSDYFRHNKYTSSGFTDSVYERDDSMINMLNLARSLAIVSKDKNAYNNSWGFRPTEEQHDFYLSLMAAMNVRWIGHAYHSSVMFGPGYPDSLLWDNMHNHLEEHREALKVLKGAVPKSDTAILYAWSSLTSFPDNYIHVHRRNLTLMAKTLTAINVSFQYISGEILESSEIKEQKIITEAGSFKRLIVPWTDMLSEECLKKIKEIAKENIEVIIFGPPANRSTNGSNQSGLFAEICGIKQISKDSYIRGGIGDRLSYKGKEYTLDPYAMQKNYGSNDDASYPDHFKYYRLTPLKTSGKLVFIDNDCVAVANGSARYFACELPHFKGMMNRLFKQHAGVMAPKDLIVFEYTFGDGGKAISGLGAWNKHISGEFTWESKKITLADTSFFVIRLTAAGDIQVYGRNVEVSNEHE